MQHPQVRPLALCEPLLLSYEEDEWLLKHDDIMPKAIAKGPGPDTASMLANLTTASQAPTGHFESHSHGTAIGVAWCTAKGQHP